jgi:hypothetical protein
MIVRCRKGTTGRTERLVIRDLEGRPLSGLSASSPGARAHFLAAGSSRPAAIELRGRKGKSTAEDFAAGAFGEIDRERMPGLYALDLPDEMLAGEGHEAVLMLRFDGAAPTVVHFDLVAYDPYDPVRLGLSCLSQEARHACLASAFQTIVPEIVDELIRVERDEPGTRAERADRADRG